MSLSDKKYAGFCYKEKDIKASIKRIKEKINNVLEEFELESGIRRWIFKEIDAEMGEALIKEAKAQ